MPDNADTLVFSLIKPVLPEELRSLRDRASQALAAGVRSFAIDIDDVGILDSHVISTLIAVLREVRSLGATVELRAARKSILDTLRITALDKVFTISEPAVRPAAVSSIAPARKGAPASRGRLVASVAAGAFAAASLLGVHGAAASGSAGHTKAGPKTPARPGQR